MKIITLVLFLLALVLPVLADTPPLCGQIDRDFAGWQEVDWSDEASERGELPGDLRNVFFTYLTDPALPDDQVQALMLEYSAERDELYLFSFWSMAYRDGGNHDMCPVRKLRLP